MANQELCQLKPGSPRTLLMSILLHYTFPVVEHSQPHLYSILLHLEGSASAYSYWSSIISTRFCKCIIKTQEKISFILISIRHTKLLVNDGLRDVMKRIHDKSELEINLIKCVLENNQGFNSENTPLDQAGTCERKMFNIKIKMPLVLY